MRLRELYKLEIGTKLRLKGTNVIFKLMDLDPYDEDRPAFIKVIEADDTVLVKPGDFGEIIVLDVNDGVSNTGWIYRNAKRIREDTWTTRKKFKKLTKEYKYVVTARDLEVYDEVPLTVEVPEVSTLLNPPETPESIEPLPVTKARDLLSKFAENKLVIKAINDSIVNAAKQGHCFIRLDTIAEEVSEQIKEQYRQAGYTVDSETIRW